MNTTRPRVLIVDDEKHMVDTLKFLLGDTYQVRVAMEGETAVALAEESPPHVALLDIVLPGMSGIEVLRRIKEVSPDTEAIMVTALNDVRKAVEAMKAGAADYITKPFDEEDLRVALEKAVEKAALTREVAGLRQEVEGAFGVGGMVGASKPMQDLFRQIDRLSDKDVNVLITGESGTGKELIARSIHYRGLRKRGPFVPVNCALFGSELTESELFGHVKGAFTGASEKHRGKFEQADGGSLFLDEVGSMPLPVQSKLLRVIEDKKVTRLGGESAVDVDVRILAATNVDLKREAEGGAFREDLYYRLKVVQIVAPPLRERPDDIPLLVDHFLKKHRRHILSPVREFSPQAMKALERHRWRGNVRELENVVLTLICTVDRERIERDDLDAPILDASPAEERKGRQVTEEELLDALEGEAWKISAAAKSLGVHRNTVRNLINRFGIEKPPSPPASSSQDG